MYSFEKSYILLHLLTFRAPPNAVTINISIVVQIVARPLRTALPQDIFLLA